MTPVAQPVGSIKVAQKVGENPGGVEAENKILANKMQENTNEVSCREKPENNNPGPTVGDADKVSSKSLIVSSCGQTRSNSLSSTSTTASNAEKDQKDQNNLAGGTTSVG